MKFLLNLFFLGVVAFVPSQLVASEEKGSAQPSDLTIQASDFLKYLSEVETGMFLGDVIASEIAKGNVRLGERNADSGRIEFSVPVYKAEQSGSAELSTGALSGGGVAAAQGQNQGNVACSVAAHSPHAGQYQPGGSEIRVKAKSGGTCNYVPVVPPGPPTIQWDLWQVMDQNPTPGGGYSDRFTAKHTKNGLNVTWYQNTGQHGPGTQVFTDGCENDTYWHYDFVIINVPPPWFVNGPNIFITGWSPITDVTGC